MQESSFKLKAQNLSCFKQSVRLLYTGSGRNSIDNYRNDRALKQLPMTAANWGNSFLTASGSAWVSDGTTLPFSFNSAINVRIQYVVGSTLFTTDLNTVAGEPIDSFFVRVAEDMSSQIGGNDLSQASPMGMELKYSNGSVVMTPSQFQVFGGSFYAIQNIEIPTTSFPLTIFGTSTYPKSFKLKHTDGWNIDIIVIDSIGSNYEELVNSLLDQSIYIDRIRKESNSPEQVLESALFKKYDISGISSQIADVSLIDPYQFQNVIDYSVDIPIDGQTYMEIDLLAGEYMYITFIYDRTAGVITYEQLKEVDALLREQGINTSNPTDEELLEEMYKDDNEQLQEAFLNFGGFEDKKQTSKLTTIILVGLLVYIIAKN